MSDTRDAALTEAPQPQFFVPLLQNPNGLDQDSLSLYLRTSHDPLTTADAVRSRIWAVDPNQPLADVSTMELAIDRFIATPRFRTMLLAVLAALGLLLAIGGIHAVTSYSVNQRTSEMAIRLALGAGRRDIVLLIVREGLALAAAGVAIGVAASLAVGHLMSGLLFEVAPIDPLTLAGVAALVMGIALAACCPAAIRASAASLGFKV